MNIKKKTIAKLTKCYSIAPLNYHGKPHFLVAAEKTDACLLFDYDGNLVEKVWDSPGGTMSMVQVPGSDGQFLATHQFYSPNDSKEAKIVIATPISKDNWEIRTLVHLPHVHRFDIVSRNGINYLIACTLKSGHNHKEDWSMPGAIYVAPLPNDLSSFNNENPLELTLLKDNLLKNHGYYKLNQDGLISSLVTSEYGVLQITPPEEEGAPWSIQQLITDATSDATLIDLDGDGEAELITLSPFHGERIRIYKKEAGVYTEIFEYEKPTEFIHALWSGYLKGIPVVVIGHRQGDRDLLLFSYDQNTHTYKAQVIDHDCGPTNVAYFKDETHEFFIATNREIDEIAMYTIE